MIRSINSLFLSYFFCFARRNTLGMLMFYNISHRPCRQSRDIVWHSGFEPGTAVALCINYTSFLHKLSSRGSKPGSIFWDLHKPYFRDKKNYKIIFPTTKKNIVHLFLSLFHTLKGTVSRESIAFDQVRCSFKSNWKTFLLIYRTSCKRSNQKSRS